MGLINSGFTRNLLLATIALALLLPQAGIQIRGDAVQLLNQIESDTNTLQTRGISTDTELVNSREKIVDELLTILNEDTFNNEDFAQEDTLSSVLRDTGLMETEVGILSENSLDNRDLFGEQKVVRRTQIIDIVSSLGTSVIRDSKETKGTGNIPSDPMVTGEIKVETGSNAGSWAVLETVDQGRYTPGQSAQAGIGLRTQKVPTGDQEWKAGYFDDDSGFFFGENSTCLYVAEKRHGELIQSKCRSSWNGENITEELGRSWNSTDGTIYQIDYSWYGYGVVLFSIVDTQDIDDVVDIRKTQQTVTVHAFTNTGNTSIPDPIQPIRVNVSNGGTAGNYQVRVGGRQYAIIGDGSNTRRIVGDGVNQYTVGSADYECLAAFQKSRTLTANNTEVKFQGISAIADGNTRFAVLYNANLSQDTTYKNLRNTPATEASLRVNNTNCELASANGLDVQFAQPNGTKLFGALASGSSTGGGSPGQIQQGAINVEVPALNPVVLVAKSVDGTNNVVSAEVRFIEKR